MEPRTFLCSRLSVLYYGQLPIKSCLDVLSQKRKREKNLWVEIHFLGWFCGVGNIYLKLNFLSPELTLPQFYSFLHEMERVRASMECLSWFLAPSLPPSLPWVAALRGTSPTGLWGADKGPACFLGAQVQRFLENNRIKYLKSPVRLLWILCEGNLQHLSPRTLFRYSNRLLHLKSTGGSKWLPPPSKFQSKQIGAIKMHTDHPPLKKARAYLWLTHVGSPQRFFYALCICGGGGALLISF